MATTKVKTITYSMPRGDNRNLPLYLPANIYTANSNIYFALKTAVDNDLSDSTAVLKKTLSDSDIVGTANGLVEYIFKLLPGDTNTITPGVYRAEFEYVSQDKLTVKTYPDPNVAIWEFTIAPEVNRRTS